MSGNATNRSDTGARAMREAVAASGQEQKQGRADKRLTGAAGALG